MNQLLILNGDGEIQVNEAESYEGSINMPYALGITFVQGIDVFTSISSFICDNHSITTSVDLGNKPLIKVVNFNKSYSSTQGITSFSIVAPLLEDLQLNSNIFTQLYLANFPNKKINCNKNSLSQINVSVNTNLKYLNLHSSSVTQLNLSNNTVLRELGFLHVPLMQLVLPFNPSLFAITCFNTSLIQLDLSSCSNLKILECLGNLTQLNISNGNNGQIQQIHVSSADNLVCIQIDHSYILPDSWIKPTHTVWSDNCNYPSLSTSTKDLLNAVVVNPVQDALQIE